MSSCLGTGVVVGNQRGPRNCGVLWMLVNLTAVMVLWYAYMLALVIYFMRSLLYLKKPCKIFLKMGILLLLLY